MSKRKRPQILPTRAIRPLVEKILRWGDRIPSLAALIQGYIPKEHSEVPLTLVMPLHPKDLWIAPLAIKYAQKNVFHPIVETLVISAADEGIQEWVSRDGLTWVNENDVLGYSKEEVKVRLPERLHYRAGWIFQQLLKLGIVERLKTEAFLVIDSDTLLLQPKIFLSDGLLRLGYSHERNLLYRKSYRKLLGETCSSLPSHVTHYMFGERKIVQELRKAIENQSGKKWDQAIIEVADSSIWTEKEKKIRPFNYFSEYEAYANFSLAFYSRVKKNYFRSHAGKEFDPQVETPEQYLERLPRFFHWASFHSYYGFEHASEEVVST